MGEQRALRQLQKDGITPNDPSSSSPLNGQEKLMPEEVVSSNSGSSARPEATTDAGQKIEDVGCMVVLKQSGSCILCTEEITLSCKPTPRTYTQYHCMLFQNEAVSNVDVAAMARLIVALHSFSQRYLCC